MTEARCILRVVGVETHADTGSTREAVRSNAAARTQRIDDASSCLSASSREESSGVTMANSSPTKWPKESFTALNLKTAVDFGGRPQALESIEVATASHFTNLAPTAVSVTAYRHKTWAETESSTAVFRLK